MNFTLKETYEGLFIQEYECWVHNKRKIYLVSAIFNVARYSSNHFKNLGIDFPPSIRKSVLKRQAEFLAGRFVASQAMTLAGYSVDNVPTIPIGEKREPIWPQDAIGSISHNSTRALCIFQPMMQSALMGIDIENIMTKEVARDISDQIHSSNELMILVNAGFDSNVATTLIFSAKECLFKALFPSIKMYFGFQYAKVIQVNRASRTLGLTLDQKFANQHKLAQDYTCFFEISHNEIVTLLY